jgi:hypothetical protein
MAGGHAALAALVRLGCRRPGLGLGAGHRLDVMVVRAQKQKSVMLPVRMSVKRSRGYPRDPTGRSGLEGLACSPRANR